MWHFHSLHTWNKYVCLWRLIIIWLAVCHYVYAKMRDFWGDPIVTTVIFYVFALMCANLLLVFCDISLVFVLVATKRPASAQQSVIFASDSDQLEENNAKTYTKTTKICSKGKCIRQHFSLMCECSNFYAVALCLVVENSGFSLW